MIYVYAVAEQLADVGGLTGVQGEPLTLVPFGGATAVVGEVTARPLLDPETLRAQDALVRMLHDRARALLPMRFGTSSSDRQEMLRSLAAHHELLSHLAAVRGCEQMVVRVLGRSSPVDLHVSAAASGTEYLQALAKRHHAAPQLENFVRGVGDLARAVKVEPSPQPGLIGTVYHLIERGGADEYRHAIDRVAAGLSGVRVLVSGPSPPYAFA